MALASLQTLVALGIPRSVLLGFVPSAIGANNKFFLSAISRIPELDHILYFILPRPVNGVYQWNQWMTLNIAITIWLYLAVEKIRRLRWEYRTRNVIMILILNYRRVFYEARSV